MTTERAPRTTARRPVARWSPGIALLTGVVLALAGCGGEGGDGGDDAVGTIATTTTTAQPATTGPAAEPQPCAEDRHAVAFDVELLMDNGDAVGDWVADVEPAASDGAVAMVDGYRSRGYEIAYLAGLPADTVVGGTPLSQALPRWLGDRGFPTGDGTAVHVWNRAAGASEVVFKTQILVDLGSGGVTVDRGYARDVHDVRAYRNGGVDVETIFTIGDAAGVEGTTGVAGTGWSDHVRAVVEDLPAVCRP